MRTTIKSRLIQIIAASSLAFLYAGTAAAEFIFTAPPRETPEQGQALYGPMAEALSKALGVQVSYEHPGSWHSYQKKLRGDEYDIIFDGPHFAAWRIENLEVTPVVRLPGELSFVLMTRSENKAIAATNDLVSKKVCALPSPNLGTLTAYSMFPNPTQQPEFVNIKGGMKAIHQALVDGKCEGAIVRKGFYAKGLDVASRAGLKVLQESSALTNQGITVSSRIDANAAEKLTVFLTSPRGQAAAAPIFKRFSKGSEKFVPAQHEDYKGHNLLAENMVFGW